MTESNDTNNLTIKRQSLLGYPIDLTNENLSIMRFRKAQANSLGLHIVTINAEMIITAMKDPNLDRIIRHADLIIPDGASIILALKLYGLNIQRLPGIELAYKLIEICADSDLEIALIGAKPEILETCKQNLLNTYPQLKIVAAQHGYFQPCEEADIVKQIAALKPKLVLIALGVPRQEFFIDKWQKDFPHSTLIGVGGSFDVWANYVKRAPKIFCDFHLEWFYRLLKEPWRYKRMMQSLPLFVWLIAKEYLNLKQSSKIDNLRGKH